MFVYIPLNGVSLHQMFSEGVGPTYDEKWTQSNLRFCNRETKRSKNNETDSVLDQQLRRKFIQNASKLPNDRF